MYKPWYERETERDKRVHRQEQVMGFRFAGHGFVRRIGRGAKFHKATKPRWAGRVEGCGYTGSLRDEQSALAPEPPLPVITAGDWVCDEHDTPDCGVTSVMLACRTPHKAKMKCGFTGSYYYLPETPASAEEIETDALHDEIATLKEEIADLYAVYDFRVSAEPGATAGWVRAKFVSPLFDMLATWFVKEGGVNYVELNGYHKETGFLTLTVQRKQGRTAHDLRTEADTKLADAYAELAKVNESVDALMRQQDFLQAEYDAGRQQYSALLTKYRALAHPMHSATSDVLSVDEVYAAV